MLCNFHDICIYIFRENELRGNFGEYRYFWCTDVRWLTSRRSSSVVWVLVPAWPRRFVIVTARGTRKIRVRKSWSVAFRHGLGNQVWSACSKYEQLWRSAPAVNVPDGGVGVCPWGSSLVAKIVVKKWSELHLTDSWSDGLVGLRSSLPWSVSLGWLGFGLLVAASSEKEGGRRRN